MRAHVEDPPAVAENRSCGVRAEYGAVRAWGMVCILSAVLLLSYVDRYALTVLVGPIKRDLALSDTQVSVLLGTAFAVVFALAGPVYGYLVDRYNRRNLVISGIVLWTLMTTLSGFAPNFITLFVCRMGLGIGEAVLTPAAYSMIKDALPEGRQGRAFGVYLFGSAIGFGAALVVIGWMSQLLQGIDLGAIPVLHGRSTWQLILVAIGLLGVPAVLLVLAIREPGREPAAADLSASLADVIAYTAKYRSIFMPLVAGYAVWGTCIFGYGNWIPTALGRVWNEPATAIGSTYGLITVFAGSLTILVLSVLLDRAAKRGMARFAAAALGLASIIVAVPTMIAPWGISPLLTWVCLGINIAFGFGNQLVLTVVLSQVTPNRMMGKLAACTNMALILVGFGVGPTLVAWVSTLFGPASSSLSRALSMVIGPGWIAFGLLMLLVWIGIRRSDLAAARQ